MIRDAGWGLSDIPRQFHLGQIEHSVYEHRLWSGLPGYASQLHCSSAG